MKQITFTPSFGYLKKIIGRAKTTTSILALLFTAQWGNAQSWENVGAAETVSAGGSSFNNLVIDAAGNYYISYYDLSVSKGSVQKFDGTTWSYLGGTAGITSGSATYNALAVAAEGSVYYSNQLAYPGAGMEVRKFSAGAWSQLPNVNVATINVQAIAVSQSNTLFAFNGENSGTVKRFVNGAWEQVGNTGFSGGATFAEMAVSPGGKIYVCNVASGNAQVYYHSAESTEGNWTLAGGTTVGAASSSEQYTSDIAIDQSGVIYVAYVSNSAGGQMLNVKKYDGENWVQVGAANFSPGRVQHVAIAVTAAGTPYVVASRWEDDDLLKNTAYKFDSESNAWVVLGDAYISSGQATYNDLAIDEVNQYLVLVYSQSGTKAKRISIADDSTPPVNVCDGTEPGNNPGDLGCVSFTYMGQTVSYTTVRGADGNIWLQQNLGSDAIATAMDDTASYGDLFQWGRWADGHQKRASATDTTTPDPNNPRGARNVGGNFFIGSPSWWSTNDLTDTWKAESSETISDTDGCDPCKALGQGWQLPSQDDWTTLITQENITSAATAYASALKLPATGYRSNTTGGFTFAGTRGYYWSSTTANTGGKYIYLSTSIANPSSGAPRGQGAAIRCVKLAQQAINVTAVTINVQNNAEAVINTAGGTLQLTAAVLPAEANQAVTWTITSGNEFATLSDTGLVTAVSNGTVTARATSVADPTKYGELAVVVNIDPACPSLTDLYENFDTLSCCDTGVVPTCWESILLGGANQIISSTQPASGTSQIYMNGYGTGKIAIVVLPHFSNINAGTHQFRFKVKANSGPGALDFGYITDTNDAATFVVLESLTINNSTYTDTGAERTLTVPTTVPAGARLALRNPGTTWAGIYWDDVYWEPIPVVDVTIATENNVAAEITSLNGTLQLIASVLPAEANQAVTWSITSGSELGSLSENGLVTAAVNGTMVVRATSVQDPTKFTEITITLSGQQLSNILGFNYDIIANGVGNASVSSQIGLDEVNSRALVSLDFQATAGSALPTYGLPVNGLINSVNTPGISFQLENYSGKNALYLTPAYVTGSVNSTNTGTLSFEAQNAGTVYILSAAAGGGSNSLSYDATINFSDSTTQQVTIQANDWYGNSGFAIKGIGRVNRANNNLEGDAENPRLYENSIVIADENLGKTITGITFSFSGDVTAEYANEIRLAILSITTIQSQVTPVEDVLTVETSGNAPATITTNSGVLPLTAYLNGIYASDVTWSIVEGGTGSANVDIYGQVTASGNGTVTVRATLNSNTDIYGEIEVTITNQEAGYCDAYFINGCSDYMHISSFATTGGTTNINNLNTGCSADNGLTGYADYTSLSVTATQGSTVTFTTGFITTSLGSPFLSVWVDWNHDFIFSDSERVYFTGNAETQSSVSFSVTVPQDAALTATRIRVKAVNGWEGSGPCGYNSFGEVEDYTFTITEAATVPDSVTITTEGDIPASITTEETTLQLVAVVAPANASQDVIWTVVPGTGNATVDENGVVTPLANGTVIIRATSAEDPTVYTEIEITINVESLGIGSVTKNAFTIYPNPTGGDINIVTTEPVKSVIIYNQLGQLVKTANTAVVSMLELPAGVYMVEVHFENNSKSVQKVIRK